MGNIAVITSTNKDLGIYLHWNGGRDSVEAFLKYCELRNYAGLGPGFSDYGYARLAQTIGNYFGGTMSVGVMPYTTDEDMASLAEDNGVYVVDGWSIVDRVYPEFWNGEQREYDMESMLLSIDASQPKGSQLGADFILSEEIPTEKVRIGDVIYVRGSKDIPEAHVVLGFGDGTSSARERGVPFVGMWNTDQPKVIPDNPNNYLKTETVRLCNDPQLIQQARERAEGLEEAFGLKLV